MHNIQNTVVESQNLVVMLLLFYFLLARDLSEVKGVSDLHSHAGKLMYQYNHTL